MGLDIIGASAISGVIAQCIVHPMDTLRCRVMVHGQQTNLNTAARTLLATSGPVGFYRGFGAAAALQAPAVATHLTTYSWAKQKLSNSLKLSEDDPRIHLSAGLIAEAFSAFFWVPMEVVKQRAQARASHGSLVVLKDLLRTEGPRSLLRGYCLTVGVFGPFSAAFFAVYEAAKKRFRAGVDVDKEKFYLMKADLLAGAAGGGVAAAITTPLDVIKTRIQTQGDIMRGEGRRMYNSTWHAVSTIAREEGLRAFGRGMTARVLWKTPGTAICMSCFENLKVHFGKAPNLQVT